MTGEAALRADVVEVGRRLYAKGFVAGNEGAGVTAAAMACADLQVRIPISSDVDSLNVATAGSIAMYHAFGLH